MWVTSGLHTTGVIHFQPWSLAWPKPLFSVRVMACSAAFFCHTNKYGIKRSGLGHGYGTSSRHD